MRNLQAIIFTHFLIATLYLTTDSQTYSDDSLIVAELLTANGYTSTPVDAISMVKNGRITSLSRIDNVLIRVLPQSIGSLSELAYINFSDNIIDEIPTTFSNLKKLKSIYLIRNRLTKWPDIFYDMPNLESIDVGGNHLTQIPDSISKCKFLKNLYTNDNYLTQLPESIIQLDLEVVHVSGNSLQNLSEPVIKWIDERDYAKEGSEWKKYQHGFCGTDSIYIQDILKSKGLQNLPNDSVSTIVNGCITELDLSYECLSRFASPDTISHGITLPDQFTYLKNLRSINLSGHKLDSLPGWFGNMCHLTHLDLSGNNFSTLPYFMVAFKNLDSLDLSGNQLSSLPPELEAWADKFDNGWKSRQVNTHIVGSKASIGNRVPKIAAIRSSTRETNISVYFPQAENSEISVYALSGRKLFTIARQLFPAGEHNLTVDNQKISRGTFLITLKSRNAVYSSLKFVKY